MAAFFDESLLLGSAAATEIYAAVKALPVIDYHCHLDQNKIAQNAGFNDIGEMWLGGDHYKWRAMRLCGVDEKYITGAATYREKFFKYAEIMPRLIGNPLYYWTHLELKQIFNIDTPLNADTAADIYEKANERLKTLTVQKLLGQYKVEYIATTDDPTDSLDKHGKYGITTVAPTFRPDKLFLWQDEYLKKLGAHKSLGQLKDSLRKRIDFFVSKGCKIADHGFKSFPASYADDLTAETLYQKRGSLNDVERDALFGHMLLFFAREYQKRGMVMQLHFSVTRNVNTALAARVGVDAGLDVMTSPDNLERVIACLDMLSDEERPTVILYSLNPDSVKGLCTLSGAFKNVYIGAAWWFNDTVEGIRRNLSEIAEYSVLGMHLGMLTDSRSFASYARFDFFRRILCDYIGEKVEKGEYDADSAKRLAADICYGNIKALLQLT